MNSPSQFSLSGWLMMLADEFKLALRNISMLETEVIEWCELKLDCFTHRIEFYQFGLICCYNVHLWLLPFFQIVFNLYLVCVWS